MAPSHHLWVVLLLGCKPEPPPQQPEPPPRPRAARWSLAAIASSDSELSAAYPHFADGVDLLGRDCEVAHQTVGGRPPPCTAELWRPTDGAEGTLDAVLLRVGKHTLLSSGDRAWPREGGWNLLGPTLGRCIGDALALPPASDADGLRTLRLDDASMWWVISLSGANPCRLSGHLRLPLTGEHPDTTGLMVDERSWSDQGALRAKEHIRSWRRLLVRERWNELTPEDRIMALEELSLDPHVEALELLRSIAARDPSAAADAQRALERRSTSTAEDEP